MHYKTKGDIIFMIVNTAVFVLIGVIMLLPFINVLCLSLEPEHLAIETGRLHLWPKEFTFDAYLEVLKNQTILNSFGNSAFVTFVGATLSLLITAMFGYGLTFDKIIGHKLFSYMLLFTMMFSGGMIPTYMLIKNLHLTNSLWSLILVGMMVPYNVILMKAFFLGLPKSLEESAMLDGASEFQIFFRIVLPLSKPILATIFLFYAVQLWNDYFNAMMFITDPAKKTLQVFLREILMLSTADVTTPETESALQFGTNLQMATAIISMVPIICVYPWLQKYFTKGTLVGAVKG